MALSRIPNLFDGKADLYKYSHWKQYPPSTHHVESYLECRVGAKYKQVVPYGLQYILDEYFAGTRLTKEGILRRNWKVTQQMGEGIYNLKGWLDLLEAHDGKLPLEIKAVPEGTVLGISNALIVVKNTDPRFPWLTNFAETALMKMWYPTTVASSQFAKRQMFLKYLHQTGDPSLIDYKWVDFGYRGVSSEESAGLGGSAHLLSFRSSDTMIADDFMEAWYNDPAKYGANGEFELPEVPERVYMGSVPAMEHSTITSWGRDNESGAIGNMLTAFPKGVVSIVGDSYDYENFVRTILGDTYREEILKREGVVVARPDSGDPTTMVLNTCKWLESAFGAEENDKGYKVLNKHVRVIQGDGIEYDSAYEILSAMEHQGYSVDNLTLGEGGGALQKVNRDTERTALKACAIDIDGVWHDVVKDPKTDPSKMSKSGHLAVFDTGNGVFRTVKKADNLIYPDDILTTVFKDGVVTKRYGYDDICARMRSADLQG